jgi:glycosyltransferase involved in cell wall biosynthesis
MRILWLTPGFAADENDLNCIPPLQLLAKELLRQGVDLQIVALEYPFRSVPYRWYGAAVFPCNGQNRRWLKPRTLWRAMNFCHDILDEAQLSESFQLSESSSHAIIHSFWLGWASDIGEKVARRHGVPHFTTLMGQDVLPENRRFLKSLTEERTARLVVVSDFQNEIFEKNTNLRARQVIPWGVNEGEIPTVLPAERSLDVLGVGSLVAVKNWEKWLKVIALAAQSFPKIQAELIGDGPERARLEQMAWQLGLEGKVRFVGNLQRMEVLSKMRQAKVLLHTARFESFGYVFSEAAMNGCRVVSTPVGVAQEFGRVAETIEELVALVLDALGQTVQKQPFLPFKMEETAAAYLRLYLGVA